MPRSLPTNPSVEFIQKEAKKLVKAHKSGDVKCCRTLRYHFRFSRADDAEILSAKVTLQEAQHALSLDYGFKNWKELKMHVESMRPVSGPPEEGSGPDMSTNDMTSEKAQRVVLNWIEDESMGVTAEPQEDTDAGPEPVEHLLLSDPLELEVGYGLVPLVDSEQGGGIRDKVRYLRRQSAAELGIVIPTVHVRDDMRDLSPSEYRILLKGVRVAGWELMHNYEMAIDPGDVTRKIEGIHTTEPCFGLPAVWIPKVKAEEARSAGYKVVDHLNIMATHLGEVLKKHAWELLGRTETKALLDNLSRAHPEVVEELVPGLLSLGSVRKVLQNLLREHVPIKDLLTIVETLADYAPTTKDPAVLTEYVRQEMARSIVSGHTDKDGILRVMTMAQGVEDALSKSIQNTAQGQHLALDPKVSDQIVSSIKQEAEKLEAQEAQPILLTTVALRRHIKAVAGNAAPSLIVLSQAELLRDIRYKSVGEINLAHAG